MTLTSAQRQMLQAIGQTHPFGPVQWDLLEVLPRIRLTSLGLITNDRGNAVLTPAGRQAISQPMDQVGGSWWS